MDYEIEETFKGMNSVIMNLAEMFIWSVCLLFHIIMLVLFLLTVWFLGIDKTTLQTELTNFYHQHAIFSNLVAFFGVSGFAVLVGIWAYVKLWKKAFAMFLIHYVWKSIEKLNPKI